MLGVIGLKTDGKSHYLLSILVLYTKRSAGTSNELQDESDESHFSHISVFSEIKQYVS